MSVLCIFGPGSQVEEAVLCTKDNFRDLTRGKGAWGRPSRYRPRRRPVVEGRLGFSPSPLLLGLPVLPFEARGSRSRSKGGTSFCTKSKFPVYRYLVSFSYGVFLSLISIFSIFIPHNSLLEWELQAPSRTRFLGGRLRRSRDRVFIVLDGDFGLKNGLGHYFSKKRLPEVGEVASGRRFLAVLSEVVLYHGPEASGVGAFGQVPCQ
jgi:hypothetical protein